jgi:hypothetical protein
MDRFQEVKSACERKVQEGTATSEDKYHYLACENAELFRRKRITQRESEESASDQYNSQDEETMSDDPEDELFVPGNSPKAGRNKRKKPNTNHNTQDSEQPARRRKTPKQQAKDQWKIFEEGLKAGLDAALDTKKDNATPRTEDGGNENEGGNPRKKNASKRKVKEKPKSTRGGQIAKAIPGNSRIGKRKPVAKKGRAARKAPSPDLYNGENLMGRGNFYDEVNANHDKPRMPEMARSARKLTALEQLI